jgi:hypothetical protein
MSYMHLISWIHPCGSETLKNFKCPPFTNSKIIYIEFLRSYVEYSQLAGCVKFVFRQIYSRRKKYWSVVKS